MPSYHLCPDFRIPPPPNGMLTLGCILKGLDEDGVQFPLNAGKVESINEDAIHPKYGPHRERGFTRSESELQSVEAGIWAKIFGLGGLSAKFSRSRGTGKFLTVKELLTRTFTPDEEYMARSLGIPKVRAYVTARRLKVPVYMITGLMIATGASWSSTSTKVAEDGAEAALTEPNTTTSAGGNFRKENRLERETGVEDSDDFVLGLRVRKIWWEKGIRQTSDSVAGRVLDSGGPRSSLSDAASGLRYIDDFELEESEGGGDERIFVDVHSSDKADQTVWVLP